jgi:hypothetical protein
LPILGQLRKAKRPAFDPASLQAMHTGVLKSMFRIGMAQKGFVYGGVAGMIADSAAGAPADSVTVRGRPQLPF